MSFVKYFLNRIWKYKNDLCFWGWLISFAGILLVGVMLESGFLMWLGFGWIAVPIIIVLGYLALEVILDDFDEWKRDEKK
jgi:hypothetical protein